MSNTPTPTTPDVANKPADEKLKSAPAADQKAAQMTAQASDKQPEAGKPADKSAQAPKS